MTDQPTPEAAEAVAMLLFAAEQCDRRQQRDLIGNWEGRLDDRDRDEYRAIARDFTEFIRDAIHRDCSTCGNTGRVDWEPGAHRDTEDDDQPCPDCRNEQAIREALGLPGTEWHA